MKAILPIALLLTAALAAPAGAAPYSVYGCHGPDDEPLSMHAFDTFEAPADSMNHDDHCRLPDDQAYFEWGSGAAVPAGQSGGWRLDAPTGTTLSALRWSGGTGGVSGTGISVEIAAGAGAAYAWTADLPQDTRLFPLPPGTTVVALRQVCRAPLCVTGSAHPRTTIRALTAIVDDASRPPPPAWASAPMCMARSRSR